MEINETKLRAITKLSGPGRYSHFVKMAADQRIVWGLYKGGWTLAADNNGGLAFPIWPARIYAEQCAIDEWIECEAREIDLDTLLYVLIPKLVISRTQLAIFPTPNEKGVVPNLDAFVIDVRAELSRIE